MADIEQGQGAETLAPAFNVLSEGDEMLIEPSDGTPIEEAPEDAEPEQADAEDEGSPLDDLEYDENDPAQRVAFEELRKRMLPKWQKRVEALKAKTEPAEEKETAPAKEPEKPAETASQDAWDYYTLDTETLNYAGDPEPEDSPLHGAEAEIDRRVAAAFKAMVPQVMDAMRKNEQIARQREMVGTAYNEISQYVAAAREHPDYDASVEQELKEILADTEQMAIKDPKKWVKRTARMIGIDPDWKAKEETPKPASRTSDSRIAAKLTAAVPRPTRAPSRASADAVTGNRTFDQAFERAARRVGL